MRDIALSARTAASLIIRIISSDVEAECLVDNIDIAILHGEGHWPGYDARLLLDETVFPVCSPGYLACFGPIEKASDLPAHSLVALEDDHWHWMSWRVWLTEKGVDLPMEHHDMIMNDYYSVLQAARAGQGVALGWRHLDRQATLASCTQTAEEGPAMWSESTREHATQRND